MQWTKPRRTNPIAALGRRFVWIGAAFWLAISAMPASGQEYFGDSAPNNFSPSPDDGGFLFSDQLSGRGGQALGALWRAGFVTGPAIGRVDSIAPFEVMPYAFIQDGMFLGDARGFRSTDDHWGANVGLGYRQYVRSWDRVFGVNAFYDYDNTSTALFRQLGFGLETLGSKWDSRLNTYFPIQTTPVLLDTKFVNGSQHFAGNNILYNQILTFGTPTKGFDHEVVIPLPGHILERHDVRWAAGWYHFQGGSTAPRIWGWKTRLQGEVTPNFAVSVEVTNDKSFDTNVIFSAALQYGGFREPEGRPRTQFSRMTTPIVRQYNIVVARTDTLQKDVVAINPNTGAPYFVEHVASSDPYDRTNLTFMNSLAALPNGPVYNPTAPLGTFENPFFTIQEAKSKTYTNPPFDVPNTPKPYPGDIVYVWANSRFIKQNVVDNSTLESGTANNPVRWLGDADGVVHQLQIQGITGTVPLPRAIDRPNQVDVKPLYTFSDATNPNAIVLASNAEFSGFSLGAANDPTSGARANGVFANVTVGPNGPVKVNNVVLQNNDINFAGVAQQFNNSDGIHLDDVLNVQFANMHVLNAFGRGLFVTNGTPTVTFAGGADNVPELEYRALLPDGVTPAPRGGNAVEITNIVGGSVDLGLGQNLSTIQYAHAGGIVIGDFSSDPTTWRPIRGRYTLGEINISDTTTAGGPINPATGVGTNTGNGITIHDSFAGTTFFGPIALGSQTNSLTPELQNNGIEIIQLNTGASVQFDQPVVITNRGAHGIELDQIAGRVGFAQFPSSASVTITSNPTTSAPNFSAINMHNSSGTVQFAGININGSGTEGINIEQNTETSQFIVNGPVSISNTNLNLVQTNPPTFNTAAIYVHAGPGATEQGTIQFNSTVTIDNRGSTGILIDSLGAPLVPNDPTFKPTIISSANFSGITTINNQSGSLDTAVILRNNGYDTVAFNRANAATNITTNNNSLITFTELDINSARGRPANVLIGDVAGLDVQDNPGQVTINIVEIGTVNTTVNQAVDGQGIFADNVGSVTLNTANTNQKQILTTIGGLSIRSGDVNTLRESAISISNSVISVNLNSVSANAAAGPGIGLRNNVSNLGPTVNLNFGPNQSAATFTVSPGANLGNLGDGGTITTSSQEGLIAVDSGSIVLHSMVFTNNGVGGTPAGALIPSPSDGIFVVDTNPGYDNNIANGNIPSSATGLSFQGVTLEVLNSSIVGSGYSGIHTINAFNVVIGGPAGQGTTIQDNGVTAVPPGFNLPLIFAPQILLQSTQPLLDGADPNTAPDVYTFQLSNIIITDNRQSDGIRVQSRLDNEPSGVSNGNTRDTTLLLDRNIQLFSLDGTQSILDFTLTNSQIALNFAPPFTNIFVPLDGLQVDWNGQMRVDVEANSIATQGFLNTGVHVYPGSTTEFATMLFTNNSFQSQGFQARDVNINLQAPLAATFSGNTFADNGDSAISMLFNLGANSTTPSTLLFDSNVITATGFNDKGISVQTISAPMLFSMGGNNFNFTNGNPAGTGATGVEFITTRGTIGFGNQVPSRQVNNVININGGFGSGNPYFVFPPNGLFNGTGVLINGVNEPP